MILTHVTISYSRTYNLGNYSNIKPSASFTVEIEETDDLDAVKARLLAEAKAIVEAEIDSALEADDQPAKFSQEPRYRVLVTVASQWRDGPRWGSEATKIAAPERLLIIVPADQALPARDVGTGWWTEVARDLRHAHALRRAAAYLDVPHRVIDGADGDLSRVPEWVWQPPVAPEPTGPAIVFGESDDASYERYRDGIEDGFEDEDDDDDLSGHMTMTDGTEQPQ